VRVLLDTHIALWAITDDPRLPAKARSLIEDAGNEIVVSAASIWEIAIKHALTRGDMPVSAMDATGYFAQSGYLPLSVTATHAAAVELLPPIHADPFDRMLVAQALAEPLRLLTADRTVARYSDSIVLV